MGDLVASKVVKSAHLRISRVSARVDDSANVMTILYDFLPNFGFTARPGFRCFVESRDLFLDS